MERIKHITHPKVTDYINEFFLPATPELMALREASEREIIPIILKEAESFLRVLLSIVQPKKILEIGTAVGYSACFFAENTDGDIYTVEKLESMYQQAQANIERLGYTGRIKTFLGDGEEIMESLFEKGEKDFDFVFIDAAKSHYKRFFKAALKLCSPGAVIVCDNVLMKGMVADGEELNPKHKTNIRNLRDFNSYAQEEDDFETTLIAIGDGLTITKLK